MSAWGRYAVNPAFRLQMRRRGAPASHPLFTFRADSRLHGRAGNDFLEERCIRPISPFRIGDLAASRMTGPVKDDCLECKNCGGGAPDLHERHAIRSQKPLPGRRIEALDSPGTVLLCNDTNVPPIHMLWANQDSVCCGFFSRCNSPHDSHLRNEYIL